MGASRRPGRLDRRHPPPLQRGQEPVGQAEQLAGHPRQEAVEQPDQPRLPAQGHQGVAAAAGLDDLASGELFEKFTSARGGGATFHELTLAELQARGLQLSGPAGADERFVHSKVMVLDRIELSQTSRAMTTRTDDSVLIASQVDRRFAEDAEFPNAWRPLVRNDAGEITTGPPRTYAAAGGYLLATRLSEPQGAILVEYHFVYREPHDWFNGANLLRSKLPIFLQSRIRALRRELRESRQ